MFSPTTFITRVFSTIIPIAVTLVRKVRNSSASMLIVRVVAHKEVYKTIFVAMKLAINLLGLVVTVQVKVFISVTFMETRHRDLLYLKDTSTLRNSKGSWDIKLQILVPKGLRCQFSSVSSIYLPIYLSIYLSIYLFVCLSIALPLLNQTPNKIQNSSSITLNYIPNFSPPNHSRVKALKSLI